MLTTSVTVLIFVFAAFQQLPCEPRQQPSRVVHTKYGSVRGLIRTLSNRRLQSVDVFLGVPFASPPIGSLRFMPPVTLPRWKKVRMADKLAPVCPQVFPDIQNETEALQRMPAGRLAYLRRLRPYLQNYSEDCLYLNIYAPARVAREPVKLPVMVYIHGESYFWNSGNPYDGSVLASYGNVVVVTINFRLGVLGFFPAIEGSARGNYGLMDQVAALHWIQENIHGFGGDSSNVTIFGHGHGAACANILMITPMAKDLFHRVILQSGSVFSPWAIAKDSLFYARHLAKRLNCPTSIDTSTIECLRHRSLQDILDVKIEIPDYLTTFGPTIDGISLQNDPEYQMQENSDINRQYDLLFGVTRAETYFQFSAKEEKVGIDIERRNRILRTLVRNLFNYHQQEIYLTIINEYTDWSRPNHFHPINLFEKTIDALGDGLTVAPLVKLGNLQARVQKDTYFYVFNHQSEEGDYLPTVGCIHGEDLPYIFGAPLVDTLAHFQSNYTRSEESLSEAVVTHWTNFARTGNPNSTQYRNSDDKHSPRLNRFDWHSYDIPYQKHIIIGMKPRVKDHYHAHQLSFWLHLLPALNRTSSEDINFEHHRLHDYNNLLSYDGIIRNHHSYFNQVLTTVYSTKEDNIPTDINENSSGFEVKSNMEVTSRSVVENNVIATSSTNNTQSQNVVYQEGIYSTTLSVTIAVGCSLLILNVLIFAGVYYQKDKQRDFKMDKRIYEQPECGDDDPLPKLNQMKMELMHTRAHSSTIPSTHSQELCFQVPTSSIPVHTVPYSTSQEKTPPPEGQPLLSHSFRGPTTVRASQEMRVHFQERPGETSV
ncbi:neuroligin-4, X-linked-like isoform X1 [Tachypleus tridentatus]|uniref:neuroligin-4, X-linked-like isoform X1 n=2 Tax=Tachypleus tridentatus TaxID=6853 RepID=UPI003FD16075